MNGAESLLKTLIDAGVEVCFANPGTSEMQFVAGMDDCDGMRPILALFEGVATGAADGYGRMTGKPAATLLHLGPGLANGMANLHNARRAGTPVLNIIGDHASYHLQYDAPLTSDVAGHAALVSDWVRVSRSAGQLPGDGAAAVVAAMERRGQVASLIVPADHSWDEGTSPASPHPAPEIPAVNEDRVRQAAEALRSGEPAALFMGGRAMSETALAAAGRIAEATGARLLSETFSARVQRGAGRVAAERLPYFAESAAEALNGIRHLILVDTKAPVSFFAYPDKPSWLSPDDCSLLVLAGRGDDSIAALDALADRVGADGQPTTTQVSVVPELPSGELTVEGIGASVARLMPEDAIVSDESTTASMAIFPMTAGAAPHDWLKLTGGAIGQGLPLAVGAAVACPGRRVLALQADGSAMYTVQSLWTMARENLDVTTVIINNGSYAVLSYELQRVGAGRAGPRALSMLDLTNPVIDWVSLSEGLGVPASRARTVDEFHERLDAALAHRGPNLVEAVV